MRDLRHIDRFWRVILLGLVLSSSGLLAQKAKNTNENPIVLGLLLEDSIQVEARYGARFAVDEINRKGGLSGRSIELNIKSMEGPWGVGSKQAVDLVFDQEAWALIGLLNGRNSHLVEQVAAKTDVPFVSAWAADPTLAKAYVPQFFNIVPNSEQQVTALLDEMIKIRGLDKWLLVSDNTYDEEIAVKSLKNQELFREKPPLDQILFDTSGGFESFGTSDSSEEFEVLLQTIQKTEPEALLALCDPEFTLSLAESLRSRGMQVPVYSGFNLLHEATFSSLISDQLPGVHFVNVGNWIEDRHSDFVKGFFNEYGRYPGVMSALAYDAVQLLVQAISESGMNPKKLKQSLSEISYSGKTGSFEFDHHGNRSSDTPIAVFNFGNLSASER